MGKLKATGAGNKESGMKKSEAQINTLFYKISRGLMEIYVLFFLCVFPLSMRDKYFDIMFFRFQLFWKMTLTYGVIYIVLGLLYLMCDALYNGGAIRRGFFYGVKEALKSTGNGSINREKNINTFGRKQWNSGRVNALFRYFHISTVDIYITVLIILFTISTVLAEYPYEAFWGDRGRYEGLLMWLMLFVGYWLVTRFYNFKKWHIWAFMAGASMVCIWGMLNFFLLTFGMFEHADENYKYIFVSSIGNINTYNAFTGIFFGISVGMFIKSRTISERICAFIAVVVSGFGQIMGISDNAVLSTGIVVAVAPILLCENYGHVSRYFTAVLTYLVSLKITSAIKAAGIPTMADRDPGIQIIIAGQGAFNYLIALIAIITVAFVILACRNRSQGEVLGEKKTVGRLKILWLGMVTMAAIGAVVVLILANLGWHKELWKPYKNILIFSDSWGTGRGLCWRLGMEFWRKDATVLMKLFGYGPDTFYIITMDRFMNIMQDAGYGMFDSAHNEYFEFFITVGIFGLASYLAFLYVTFRKMLFHGNDWSRIIAIGILAYVVQAVVNIAVSIVTPILMTLLFVGLVAANCNKIVD